MPSGQRRLGLGAFLSVEKGTRRPSRMGTRCWSGGEGGREGRRAEAWCLQVLPILEVREIADRFGEGCSVFLKEEPWKTKPLKNVQACH